MKKTLKFLLFLSISSICFSSVVRAETEIKFMDSIDEFTDKRSINLIAMTLDDGDELGQTLFHGQCSKQGTYFGVKIGIQFHIEDIIAVKYRLGKLPMKEEAWTWDSNNYRAYVMNERAVNMISGLYKNQRFLFAFKNGSKAKFEVDNFNDTFEKFDAACVEVNESYKSFLSN